MPRDLGYRAPPALAIAPGATTPTGQLGAVIWSTSASALLVWDGSKWASIGTGGGGGYPSIAYPKRSATPKIAGDAAGTALGTLALTASRQYFVPFVVPRAVSLTGLRISVTTSSAGMASIGIYANTVVSGNDAPGSLLASVTGLDTGTTGDKSGSVSLTLAAGTLYWASVIGSAAATLRALAVAAIQTALGRQVNNTGVISHLWAAGSGSTLPDPAPTSLTDGTGSAPAIYLLE